jgi:hypothetical protein
MRSACSLDSSPFVVVILFRYRDSYLTKPSGSAFLIIFRVDAPLSIENWLSLGTHSFLYGLGRFSPMNGSYQILMFDFTEFIQFIGLSLSVFLFCVHSRILSAQFTGLIPFWINFFRVLTLWNLWTHSFRIDLSMWGFFEIISRFQNLLWCHFLSGCFRFFVACTKQDVSDLFRYFVLYSQILSAVVIASCICFLWHLILRWAFIDRSFIFTVSLFFENEFSLTVFHTAFSVISDTFYSALRSGLPI